jgi:hypothetical protein
MTDNNVSINDLNEEQLRNAVNSLLAQIQQSEAAVKDLGVKVANKEIENSKLKAALESIQKASQQEPTEESEDTDEEGAEEESE